MQRIRTPSQNGTWPIATVDRSTCRQLPSIEKTLFLLPVRTQISGMMCFGQLRASNCAKGQSHSLEMRAQSQTQAHTAEDDSRSHVAALHIHTDLRQMPELDTYTNGTSGPTSTGYAWTALQSTTPACCTAGSTIDAHSFYQLVFVRGWGHGDCSGPPTRHPHPSDEQASVLHIRSSRKRHCTTAPVDQLPMRTLLLSSSIRTEHNASRSAILSNGLSD